MDRQNKKRIMLIADLVAACGTLAVFILHSAEVLQIWHLYVINFLLSLMNAFQEPASFVAVSLLVPLQGFSGAAVSILAPALGALLLAAGGLDLVLMIDLATFAVAFLVLLFLIRIPEPEQQAAKEESFSKTCLEGIRYLKEHTAILRITLFLAVINFLAKLGNDGMLSPFILGRTGNNQSVLGMVESFTAKLYGTGRAGREPAGNNDETGQETDPVNLYCDRPGFCRKHFPEPDFPSMAVVRCGVRKLSDGSCDERKYGYPDAGEGSHGDAGPGVLRKEYPAEFHDSAGSPAGRPAG